MEDGFLVAFNRTSGREVAARVLRADTFLSRLIGLMGRASLAPGNGLWIEPCAMIHTGFMRFDIDVLFLDRDLRVARVMERMKPWRFSPWVRGARSVLELPGGTLKGSVAVGDIMAVK